MKTLSLLRLLLGFALPVAPALAAEPATSDAAEVLASLACDAQTSGGLLLCLPPARAAACVEALRELGLPAAHIGALVEPGEGGPLIELTA